MQSGEAALSRREQALRRDRAAAQAQRRGIDLDNVGAVVGYEAERVNLRDELRPAFRRVRAERGREHEVVDQTR